MNGDPFDTYLTSKLSDKRSKSATNISVESEEESKLKKHDVLENNIQAWTNLPSTFYNTLLRKSPLFKRRENMPCPEQKVENHSGNKILSKQKSLSYSDLSDIIGTMCKNV